MSEVAGPSCLSCAPTGTSAPTSTAAGWRATSPTGRGGGRRLTPFVSVGGFDDVYPSVVSHLSAQSHNTGVYLSSSFLVSYVRQ